MNPSLVARITKAFEDMPPPVGQVISVETQDDEGTTEYFLGTRWQEHTPESLQNFTALSFFTPEAFCYYLPAYILAAMKQPSSGIADSLIEYLCPPKKTQSVPATGYGGLVYQPTNADLLWPFWKSFVQQTRHT